MLVEIPSLREVRRIKQSKMTYLILSYVLNKYTFILLSPENIYKLSKICPRGEKDVRTKNDTQQNQATVNLLIELQQSV